MMTRTTYPNRQAWLAGRNSGIGASEAAAIIGISPWLTSMKLWQIKIGAVQPKDLSENESVERGVRLEPALRTMFGALHPEYEIEYHAYDTLQQEERPWLFATLDGELIHRESGERGILEIKTAAPVGKSGWAEWADGNVKPSYYAQILHQFLATGYSFAVLFAALFDKDGNISLRQYEFSRQDCEEDLRWLLEKEETFWRCVETRTLPSMVLA